MLNNLKMWITALVFSLIVSVGTGAKWYLDNLHDRISELERANQAYVMRDIEQDKTIDKLKQDVASQKDITEQTNQRYVAARTNLERLENRFRKVTERGARDIGVIALSKPNILEKVITNATTNANRCSEILSGSPLTEDEKNATTRRQINPECPHIANPNYSFM